MKTANTINIVFGGFFVCLSFCLFLFLFSFVFVVVVVFFFWCFNCAGGNGFLEGEIWAVK